MVLSSAMSDVSSWDDCDSSRASWDVVSRSEFRAHSRAHSQASSHGVAVISDLDAFNISDDIHHHDNDNEIIDDDDDDASSIGMCSISTVSTVCCPLTLETFRHPYYCEVDHRVYEKAAILNWVRNNGTSPITRQPVRLDQLRPLDSNEDDNESISSEMGWPRPRPMLSSRTRVDVNNRPQRSNSAPSFNFRNALLVGGGGIESEKAKALSKKRPSPFIQTVTTDSNKKSETKQLQNNLFNPHLRKLQSYLGSRQQSANADTDYEDEESDLFYAEYEARKGSLARQHGRLVIDKRNFHKRRHGGVYGGSYGGSFMSRDCDNNLDRIAEYSDDEEDW